MTNNDGARTDTAVARQVRYYYQPESWSGLAIPHTVVDFSLQCAVRAARRRLDYRLACLIFALPLCLTKVLRVFPSQFAFGYFFYVFWLSNRNSDLFMQTRAIIFIIFAVVAVAIAAFVAVIAAL